MTTFDRRQVRVEGLAELDEALSGLKKATAKSLLKKALMAGGMPIAEEAEKLAPRRTGDLALSHTVSQKLSRRQKAVHAKWVKSVPPVEVAGQRGDVKASVWVFVGPGARQRQAVPQEFGTAEHPAKPFLRPAFDSKGPKALQIIVETLTESVKQAVARAARKAERLAAKIKAGT